MLLSRPTFSSRRVRATRFMQANLTIVRPPFRSWSLLETTKQYRLEFAEDNLSSVADVRSLTHRKPGDGTVATSTI
jgi:hypothetical protein